MDTATPAQAPVTDDQELAKVLESMNSTLNTSATTTPKKDDDKPATEKNTTEDSALQFESAPLPETDPVADATAVADVATADPVVDQSVVEESVIPEISIDPAAPVMDSELESIKKEALTELRPLVDKLELSPQDKFDTLLLIIRSTDDKTLVSQAHAAAKTIEDETRRAEALLDVIKEIDYFSNPQQPAA